MQNRKYLKGGEFIKKKIVMLVTVLLVCTFIGSAVSASDWSSFSTVKRYSTTTGYTFFVQRICEGTENVTCSIDGVWGANTTSAVKSVQTHVGVTADGIVGINSWDAMRNTHVEVGYDAQGNLNYFQACGDENDQLFLCYKTPSNQWYTRTGGEVLYQFK